MHCQMAFGSLSAGRSSTPCLRAKSMRIGPAMMIASLFTRTISLPASIAAMVGPRAASPTVAETTRSTSGKATISSMEQLIRPLEANSAISFSVPSKDMYFGRNSLT